MQSFCFLDLSTIKMHATLTYLTNICSRQHITIIPWAHHHDFVLDYRILCESFFAYKDFVEIYDVQHISQIKNFVEIQSNEYKNIVAVGEERFLSLITNELGNMVKQQKQIIVNSSWDDLSIVARPYFVKKILITGIESSGKTTLASMLAQHFKTVRTIEFGRVYPENLFGGKNAYIKNDFKYIAAKQSTIETETLPLATRFLFCDTDATVTKFFEESFVGESSSVVREFANANDYSAVLFLEPAMWKDDGIRILSTHKKRMDARDKLFSYYKESYENIHCIHGDFSEKFTVAKNIVEKLYF